MRTLICGRWRKARDPILLTAPGGHAPGGDGVGTSLERPCGVQDCAQRMRMGREPPVHRQEVLFGVRRNLAAIHEF
jgi:hypothetical protein